MYKYLRSFTSSGPNWPLRSSLERRSLVIRHYYTYYISTLFLSSPRNVWQWPLRDPLFLFHVACRRRWLRDRHARRNPRSSWHNKLLHQWEVGRIRHNIGHHSIGVRHPSFHCHHMATCSWFTSWAYYSHRWNVVFLFWEASTGIFEVSITRWTSLLLVEWFQKKKKKNKLLIMLLWWHPFVTLQEHS